MPHVFNIAKIYVTRLHVLYSHSEFFKGVLDRIACGVENYPRSVPRLIVALDDILPTR